MSGGEEAERGQMRWREKRQSKCKIEGTSRRAAKNGRWNYVREKKGTD